jgi:hypothetical protein
VKVLVVEPMKPPFVKDIDGSLHSLQALIGGTIQAFYPFKDSACIVCNDEGKLLNLPYNRFIKDKNGDPYDVICGTFFIVGLGAEDFQSLTDKQVRIYTEMFNREYLVSVPTKQRAKAMNDKQKER